MGAKRHAEVGLLAQRGLLLCLLIFVPLAVFWWSVQPLLMSLGQPPPAVELVPPYKPMSCIYLVAHTVRSPWLPIPM